jgi:hypothetical protein
VAYFEGLNYMFKESFAIWQIMEQNIIPQKLSMNNITNPDTVSRVELCFETNDLDEIYEDFKKNDVMFYMK